MEKSANPSPESGTVVRKSRLVVELARRGGVATHAELRSVASGRQIA
ncbi:MAG: hypothetical protein ABIZ07_05895 [Dermatophilaceae bacterium]